MYFLMNKDREVARFSINDGDFGIDFEFENHTGGKLPFGFTYINEWIDNRKASKHNSHLRQIMADCGCGRTEGFIRITHAASINDTFWIREEGEHISWKDVSFYSNEFDEVISRLAFEGLGLYGIRLSHTSPELSTSGSFRKCWMREDGGIFLYKRGSSGFANTGLEPYCEVLASEIASKLCADSVSYGLVRLHGELASKCRLFTDEKCGYAPVSSLGINYGSPSGLLKYYSGMGCEDLFRRMLVLDALTFNVDRHAGNYGILFDNDTLEPVKMAPLFDFNLSMLPYAMKEDFNTIYKSVIANYSPCIGEDFTRMAQQALTPAIRADLVSLKGFRFSFRGDDMFPGWRVKAMERLVNKHIDAILSKTPMYTKDVFDGYDPTKQKTIAR